MLTLYRFPNPRPWDGGIEKTDLMGGGSILAMINIIVMYNNMIILLSNVNYRICLNMALVATYEDAVIAR